jgi:hypothetical protein
MAKKKKCKRVEKRAKRKPTKSKKVLVIGKSIEPISVSPEPEVSQELEPFDTEEWMEEQGLKRGEWECYHGEYEKEFCEVRRKDGVEVGPCWPNNGKFVRLDTAIEVSEGDVALIRYFKPKYKVPHEEDEWGRDEEQDDSDDTEDSGD